MVYILLILALLLSLVLNLYLASKVVRYDGLINIFKSEDGKTTYSLDGVDPDQIESMSIVRYKVTKNAE